MSPKNITYISQSCFGFINCLMRTCTYIYVSSVNDNWGKIQFAFKLCCKNIIIHDNVWNNYLRRYVYAGLTVTVIIIIVRGPGAEPGKWVQSFFLDVFMLYGYCTLWNRVMAFSQHWAFWNNEFYIFSPIGAQNSGFTWSGKTQNHFIYPHNW